ncbi:hypothetical protein OIU34_19945 [Pararhizobium sp. BT-229]|uniref:hypothetical protein n=1 Tax=Pararhizobium sp. BT-229 TaxID=2986923 RepID=UPI0021F77E4B|nr:hypothetical protein [Pararhizobium sp. BT-229]MCV9964159.1 hypothetical protein [Pararhizobium sp. BT-229]
MTSKRLLLSVLLAGMATASPVTAGYNSRDEAAEEDKIDIVITQFKKDGMAGQVFEFNPVTIPNQRCVVFRFGDAGGMQCFPRPDAPKSPN